MKRAKPPVFLVAIAALLLALLPLAALAAPQHQAATPAATPQAPVGDATPDVTPAAMSSNDWTRVRQAGKLVVGTAADYVPFEFYNSQFQLDGFDIQLARALGEQLGVEVEINDFAFDGLLDALRLGQIDVAMAAISVTPDRQQLVDFTNLYYVGEDAALMRSKDMGSVTSATDLAGRKVGVERGTTYQTWVQRNVVDTGLIEQDSLVPYIDTTALLRDLRNGTVDIALMGLLPAQDAAKRFPDLAIAGSNFNKQQFAIATPKGSTLVEPLNEALLALQSNGSYADLVARYLQADAAHVTPSEESGKVENPPPPTPPATPESNATPTAAATVQPAATTAPAATPCIDGMAFIEDVTFDDHNMTAPPVMSPGEQFVKIWRVQNSGTCTWDANYALAFVNGNRIESSMGGTAVPLGQSVAPGATVDIAASLRAPQTYGTFQGFWKMRNSQGQSFGEVVWVGIQVPDPNPPPPPPAPPAPPPPPPSGGGNPNLRADANYINPGQCTTIRWDIDGVSDVYFIDGGNPQGVGGHDTRNVCPGSTTTYTLRVVYTNNTSTDFPITINVGGGGNAPYSINFWADRDSINKGECTTLRWDVRNVNAVFLNGEGVPGQSARDVCPGQDTTYTLNVIKQDGGQDSRQVTIRVKSGGGGGGGSAGVPPRIDQFKTDANEIASGKCVHLEYRVSDVGTARILRNGQQIFESSKGQDKHKDCPPGPGLYEYKLNVTNRKGEANQALTVNVTP